jgi:hypothetical protein
MLHDLRHHDRRENAKDHDDDEDFDERESARPRLPVAASRLWEYPPGLGALVRNGGH